MYLDVLAVAHWYFKCMRITLLGTGELLAAILASPDRLAVEEVVDVLCL